MLADTNVVIDFCGVTAERTERARLLGQRIGGGERLVITEVVLAECFWVLQNSYGWDQEESATVLSELGAAREFRLESEILARGLAFKLAHPAVDIADCLLAARVLQDGDTVVTHDRRLVKAIEAEALKGTTDV